MNEKTFKAVVLDAADYKDFDRAVTLLGAEGRFKAVLRGSKKPSAKLRAFAQPFVFAEFSLATPTSGYGVVTGATMIDSFFDLTVRPELYFAGCFLLEVADKVSSADPSAVFVDVLRALNQLTYAGVAPPVVVTRFVLKILADCGYKQRITKCAQCGVVPRDAYYDAQNGGIRCELCRSGTKLTEAEYADLKIIATSEWEFLAEKDFPNGARLANLMAHELENVLDVRFCTAEMLK